MRSLTRRELLWPFLRRDEPVEEAPPAAPAPAPAGRGFARRGMPGARPLPAMMAPRVVAARCLAVRGGCSTCVERCPDHAVLLVGGVPAVDEAACSGCGICVGVCPAPTLAFELVRRTPT